VRRPSIRLSLAAAIDILEQTDWYEHASGTRLATRWENAVTSTLLRIRKRPLSGSPCSFSLQELRNIRRMPITGFPKHLVFYRYKSGEIEVLRIVHGARDLENLF
jgi:toxin ParE1/3/4